MHFQGKRDLLPLHDFVRTAIYEYTITSISESNLRSKSLVYEVNIKCIMYSYYTTSRNDEKIWPAFCHLSTPLKRWACAWLRPKRQAAGCDEAVIGQSLGGKTFLGFLRGKKLRSTFLAWMAWRQVRTKRGSSSDMLTRTWNTYSTARKQIAAWTRYAVLFERKRERRRKLRSVNMKVPRENTA